MDTSKKEYILEKLVVIFKNSSSGGLFIIVRDDVYKEVLKLFLKERGWKEKFSEKFLDTKLSDVVLKMLKDGNDSNKLNYLNDAILELDSFSIEQKVYIPLFGITMSIPELQIGNVILKKMGEAEIAEMREKTKNFKDQQEMINKKILNHVCAEFSIIAEPDKATELATEETRRVMDLLRYAIPFIYSRNLDVFIEIQGNICNSWRYVVINSNAAGAFASRGTATGPLFEFEISPDNIKLMDEIGIFKLSEMLQKEEISKFQRDLLLSLHWFSNGQMKTEPEDQLLNLITCLEIIFTPESRDPITQNIAEGAAILIQDDPDKRKATVSRIRELYGKRSSLSHKGKGNITATDLLELTQIAKIMLFVLIKKSEDFKDKSELHNWVEYKRLGGLDDPETWKAYCAKHFKPKKA